MKLFDSELRLMELIWAHDGCSAKELSLLAGEAIGWNKNTTYTILKKLVAKEAVERQEPGFRCKALVTKNQIAREETGSLVERLFGGSRKAFFAAFLQSEQFSDAELYELKTMIDRHEE